MRGTAGVVLTGSVISSPPSFCIFCFYPPFSFAFCFPSPLFRCPAVGASTGQGLDLGKATGSLSTYVGRYGVGPAGKRLLRTAPGE